MTKKTLVIFKLLVPSLLLLPFFGCNPDSPMNSSIVTASDDSAVETLSTKIIQQALTSDNPQARSAAIEVVAAIPAKQAARFMPGVQRLLSDEIVPVRFAAAVAIGDTRYTAGRNDVLPLLKDNDENVRIAAGYAVYKLGTAGGLGIIRKAITNPDQQVRANAAFLLGKTGNRSNLPLLYQAMKDEASDDRVRLNAIEAIARLGDDKIYQKLWAMLISAYADDRVCGIQAMGALGSARARDAILTMLKDDLPEIRLAAAEQLAKLGDTSGEQAVLDALTQGNADKQDREGRARIQTLSALAIGQIKTPAVKKFLPELLKNDSLVVRLAAARAVFQCATRDNIGQ